MSKEPFTPNFLCNFTDDAGTDDGINELLAQVKECDWSVERLSYILKTWHKRPRGAIQEEQSSGVLSDIIELTLIFIEYNFTGPATNYNEFRDLLAEKGITECCNPFERLMENGEEINPNVRLGELLVVAKDMLSQLLLLWPESMILHWWHLRLIYLHQHIIDDLTENLYKQLKTTAKYLMENADALEQAELRAMLYLELANAFLLFHRVQKCEEMLEKVCECLKVQFNIEGILGKRTKFQTKPLPILCLKVEQNQPGALLAAKETHGEVKLNKLLLLDDDTRLECPQLLNEDDSRIMSLPSILQALVLAKAKLVKRYLPKDRLTDEELEPFVHTLLYQEHGPYQVRQSALLLNCVLESKYRRTVERSWQQCEGIVKQLNESPGCPRSQRFSYAFCSFVQPKWQVQMHLCELQMSLGMVKSALDVYTAIQAWPEVIECYNRLELRHKAAEIIRQELAKRPTVLLHCLLGDATDDPTCYATAWEFSKQTSGKAQAYWGNYFFGRKEYKEAIPHLEKSVEINALQESIWLRLGYSAIMTENWDLAVRAYITYTHLEPSGFESWNNLAKALIKLGDKKRAHKVLSESLKCNYSNWKVWENFMLVSVDTGNFEDALNAYLRLAEIKQNYLDLEVLGIIMNAIAKGTPDAKGQPASRLRKKALTMMGHECIRHGNEPKLWELAAAISPTPLARSTKLVKAYRSYMAKERSWVQQQASANKALTLCREICAEALNAITEPNTEDETDIMVTAQLNSARLSAQACVNAVDREREKFPENAEIAGEVKELLERITVVYKERLEKKSSSLAEVNGSAA